MSAWTCLRQGRLKDRSTSSSNPMMEGPCADSGEKHEPASDVDAAAVDSLKALDPSRPIREADISQCNCQLLCHDDTLLLARAICAG